MLDEIVLSLSDDNAASMASLSCKSHTNLLSDPVSGKGFIGLFIFSYSNRGIEQSLNSLVV